MIIKPRIIKDITIINARRPRAYSQFSILDPMPPEGPILIATVLKQMGYQVRVIDESLTPLRQNSSLWKVIANSDIIGVSAMTCTENRAYWILKQAKKLNPNCFGLAGGIGPSSNPDKALAAGADLVVIGEGEDTIKELLWLYQKGGNYQAVPGIAWAKNGQSCYGAPRPLIKDLDTVPFADFSLLIKSAKVRIRTITMSRGCPFRCTFCSVTKFYGASYRHRSVAKSAAYLKQVYQGHRSMLWSGSKTIFLGDDNIAAVPAWTKQFFQAVIKLSLPQLGLVAQMRSQVWSDSQLLDLAKQAGVGRICFGYEDITVSGLQSINKKQNVEDIVRSIEQCKKRGISVNGMFILGLDHHTPQSGIEMAEFALKNGIDAFLLYLLVPIPGTEDTKRIVKEERLLGLSTDFYDGHFAVFKPCQMTPAELQKADLAALKYFYRLGQTIRDFRAGKISLLNAFYRLAGCYYVRKAKQLDDQYARKYL